MTLRRIITLAITEEENKKLDDLRNLRVKIVDVFRRGLEVLWLELADKRK